MYYEIAKTKFNKLVKNYKKIDIIILAIETSCDETSIAVVKNGNEVLSNIVSSQIEIHARFGGVVPEVASRNHLLALNSVLKEAINKAKITFKDISVVAVTYGAGLVGSLMVGVSFAKALAFSLNIPLIAVNHINAHISANYITNSNLTPPFLSLVVSGGHTALIKVTKNKKILIGTTHDDAIGEAYDKVAKVLGLEYPGGPVIDKLSYKGKANIKFIKKPREKNNFNFSYSGLKTAVINYLHKLKQAKTEPVIEDVCASFQKEAVEEVVEKSILACKKFKLNVLAVAGGVAANSYLRKRLNEEGKNNNIKIVIPPIDLCTDNAAMVDGEAYQNIIQGVGLANLSLTAQASINLKYTK